MAGICESLLVLSEDDRWLCLLISIVCLGTYARSRSETVQLRGTSQITLEKRIQKYTVSACVLEKNVYNATIVQRDEEAGCGGEEHFLRGSSRQKAGMRRIVD